MNRAACTAKSRFKKATHVIFDLDGLLLDTERLYTEATQNVVGRYGKTYDWPTKLKLMGLKGSESAKAIVQLLELPLTWEEYYELVQEQYKIIMPNANILPDTESIYKQAIGGIAKEHGKIYTTQLQARVIGTPEETTARIVVEELRLPLTKDEFLSKFTSRAKLLLSSCRFMPGAERLVRHLHRNNIPIALATSSTKESYDLKTSKYQDIFSLFHHKVTGGNDPEVLRGKPAPDIFLIAAKRFADNPSPEQCLVLEDAPNGVTGALAAGMQVIMVPDSQTPRELCQSATQVLRSLEEVKLEDFGLPPLQKDAVSIN